MALAMFSRQARWAASLVDKKENMMDNGAQQADGLSQAEPVPVSSVPASIPSAMDLLQAIRKAIRDWAPLYREFSGHNVDPAYLSSLANDVAFSIGILEAVERERAQAIEARSGETRSGSTVGESAVRQDAPND